jgi:hypothetical protein
MAKIEPNQQLLLAMTKATTGANAHDVGEFADYYRNACKKERGDIAALWEQAFNAFLSGRITPLRKAVAEVRYKSKPPMFENKEWWKQGQ